MKLEKAIELIRDAEASLRLHKFPDHADAVKLGGEALKRILNRRQQIPAIYTTLLPGETEE